ncbi:hypothetical protein DFJ74DRAFT_664931 [Hyaloraphidium curvatum]|nr:hypothetical protein DFJ74DRAFT_664931 [Hyaloraphidium curvatum]
MGLDLTGATDNPDDEDDVQITYEGPARVHGLTSPLRAIAEAARAHGPGNPRASGNGNEPVDGVTVKLESDSEEEREQPETRAPDLESSDSDQFPGDGPANADWPESDSEPGSSPLPSPSFSALLRNSGPGSQSCGTPAKGTPKSSASPLRQKDLNIGASVLGLDFSQASKPFLGLAAERHVPSEDEDGRSEASGDQANSLSGDGAAEEDEPTEEEEGEKEDVAEWRTDDERDHLGQPATEEDQAPAASVVGLGLQDWDPMEGDAGDGVTEGSGADKVHSEGAGTEDSSSSEEDSEYGPAWRARTPTAPVIRRRTFGRKRKGDRHGSSGGDDDTSVSEAPPRPPPLKRQRGDSADDEDIDAPTRAYFEALHDPADYAKEGSTYGKALGVWQSTRAELTRTKGTFGQLLGDGTSKCDPVLVRYDSEDSGGIKRCMSPLVRAVKLRCDSGSSAQSSTGVFPLVVKPGDSSNPFRIIKTCKDYEKNPLFLLLERQSKGNDVVFDVAFLHLCSDRLTLELGGLFASRFWVGIGECKSILVGPADQKLVNKLPALTASKLSRNNVLRLLFPDAPLPVPAAPRARAASVLTEASPAVPAQPRTAAASSAQREKKDPQAAVAAISPRLQAPPEEPATYPDDDPEKNEHLRLGLLQIAKGDLVCVLR